MARCLAGDAPLPFAASGAIPLPAAGVAARAAAVSVAAFRLAGLATSPSTWVRLPRRSSIGRGLGVVRQSRERTNGRGGFQLSDGNTDHQTVMAFKKATAKSNVHGSVLGVTENDEGHLSRTVSAAVVHLQNNMFCFSDVQLHSAIRTLKAAGARLKVCVTSWGACSSLACSLMGQRCNLSDGIVVTRPAASSASSPEPASSAPSFAFPTPASSAGAPPPLLGQSF